MTNTDRHENTLAIMFMMGVAIFLIAAIFGIVLLFVESALWGCLGLATLGVMLCVVAANAP